MNEAREALQRAREVAGGAVGLGRQLGISPQAVSQWGRVPAERVVDVERITGIPRAELRPDLFGERESRPANAEARPS